MAWPFDRHTHRMRREAPDAIIPGYITATRQQKNVLLVVHGQILVEPCFTELVDKAPVEDEDNSCAVVIPGDDVGKSCNVELPGDRTELACDVWSSTDSESTVIAAKYRYEIRPEFRLSPSGEKRAAFRLSISCESLVAPCRTRHGSRSCPGYCPRVLAWVPVPSVVGSLESNGGVEASAKVSRENGP